MRCNHEIRKQILKILFFTKFLILKMESKVQLLNDSKIVNNEGNKTITQKYRRNQKKK